MTNPATKEDVVNLAKLCRSSAEEQNEAIRILSWEMTKMSFWVAVLQKTHPDRGLMDRASAAVARANEIPDRVEAKDALLGALTKELLKS